MIGSFDKLRKRPVRPSDRSDTKAERQIDMIKRVKENETFFSAIQGQDQIGFWKWNITKEKLLISDNFQKVLGYEGHGYMVWSDLIHRNDYAAFLEEISDIDANSHKLDLEFRIWESTKNNYFWVRCFGEKTSDGDDSADFKMMGSMMIIDQIKERDEELEQIKNIGKKLSNQNQQLEEFVNIASHNLRSPIGNIQTLVSLYDMDQSDENRTFVFEQLKKVSKNLNVLVQELTDVAQIKKGSHQQREWIELQHIFQLVKGNLVGEIREKRAIVRADFSANQKVYYSKQYLESILQNLIGNALKYASPDRLPLIEVKTMIVGKAVVLEVCDNGLGIDMEKYGTEIFKLYKTFHNHKDARGEGLFITKTQVESMGGEIEVKSKLNVGTCFTVNLGE